MEAALARGVGDRVGIHPSGAGREERSWASGGDLLGGARVQDSEPIRMNGRGFEMDLHTSCLCISLMRPCGDGERIEAVFPAESDPWLPTPRLPDYAIGEFDLHRLPDPQTWIQLDEIQLLIRGSGLPPGIVDLLPESMESLREN